MNNKVTSVIYGSVMTLMVAVAYLVAADILLPENIVLVAALVMASLAAIIADILSASLHTTRIESSSPGLSLISHSEQFTSIFFTVSSNVYV